MSELGTKLRDARIEKGYTLNTLQQMTKIQKKYLVAIEEGRFEEIPGNFYTRAFVKQYADMVGLDGDELLLEHQAELERVEHGVAQYEEEPAQQMPSRLIRNKQQADQSVVDRVTKHIPIALLVAIILGIMFILTYAITRIGTQERERAQSSSEATALVSSVDPSAAAQVSSNAESTSSVESALAADEKQVGKARIKLVSGEGEETTYTLSSPLSEYHFSVKGKGYVWVGVYEDELITTDTTITEGETLDLKVNGASKSVRIRLGYPEGGTILVNGTEVKIDNPYITDSIAFKLAEGVPQGSATEPTNTESTQDEEAAGNTTQQSFQGPAVLDPNNQTGE